MVFKAPQYGDCQHCDYTSLMSNLLTYWYVHSLDFLLSFWSGDVWINFLNFSISQFLNRLLKLRLRMCILSCIQAMCSWYLLFGMAWVNLVLHAMSKSWGKMILACRQLEAHRSQFISRCNCIKFLIQFFSLNFFIYLNLTRPCYTLEKWRASCFFPCY